jgi:hypothetical protein
MTAVTRNALYAALAFAAMGLVACGPTTPGVDGGGGGTGGGGGADCVEDTDCPDPQFFFCNTVTSQCEPSCRTKDQCNNRPAEYELAFCKGSLGCQCDEGKCVGSLCSADSDCGTTQVCRSGACVNPPAATEVTKCQITPDLAVMAAGSKATFFVSAWGANNTPIVLKDGATWSASSGSPLTGSGTGLSAEFTAGSTAATTATNAVTATIGSVTCTAKAIVLPAPGANEVAVAVIDELSGRPVQGAKVVLSQTDGTIIQQGGNDAVDTSAAGHAALQLTGNPTAYSVSVFHADFSYVTVANYSGSARFLAFALRRNATDTYGGYKGKFNNVPATSNVHAALAGMSIAGSITNLNITSLLGPSVETDIVIGSAINQQDVPIPAGVFLGFGDQKIKDDVAGLGLNGVCADESKTAAGTCGTRTAWALAGDVPLGDLPIDAVAGGLDNIDIGALLSRILPIFKKFNSSIVRDVEFNLVPTPGAATGNPAYPNYRTDTAYAAADHDFTQVPLAFSFAAKLPELPKYKGTFVDGAAIIGGANVVGRGVVPLGIGVGVNTATPIDGQVDKQADLPAAGMISVRMAPTHHGIEGSHYGLLIAAISAKGLTDASAGVGASALFPRLPGNKLVFDPKGTTPIDVSGQAFPAYPEGAKFNFTSTAQGAVPARSFRIATAVSNVNVLRVSFSDFRERRWDVLVDPASTSTSGFTLPTVPGTLADRLFFNNLSTGERSDYVVQAFRMAKDPLAATPAAVTFNNYVELNDTNADRTTDFLTAFSFLNYGRPAIKFTTPSNSPATIAKGSKLEIKVNNFSIGTTASNDGVLKLSFTGGTGCTDVVLKTEVTAGSGELEHTLPMACGGTGVMIKAELLAIDETTPVAPPVSTTITATIQ